MSLRSKSVALLFMSGVFTLLLIVGSPMPASAVSSRASVSAKVLGKYQQIQGDPFGDQLYGTPFRSYGDSYGASNEGSPSGNQFGTSFRWSTPISSDTPLKEVMDRYSYRSMIMRAYLWCAARGGKFAGFIGASHRPFCTYTYSG